MEKLWYKKKSLLHGSGLFALSNIKKGEQVIEYIGDKVTKKEGDKRADKQIKKAEKNKAMLHFCYKLVVFQILAMYKI